MQKQIEKRKRGTNFSDEEKLRFVRLIQEKGHVIISKITSHDTRTNKLKEQSWEAICRDLNSSGFVLRTVDALKKLWQKLKSDAKIHKSVAGQQVRGTGGGPPIKMDNPVLDLVVEMTGRGSSGISGVADCDSDHLPVTKLEILGEGWDGCKPPLSAQQPPPPPPAAAAQVLVYDTLDLVVKDCQIVEEFVDVSTSPETVTVTELPVLQDEILCSTPAQNKKPNTIQKCLKRRRPQLDHLPYERSGPARAEVNYSNSFASDRVRSERAKLNLIQLKHEQEIELHMLRMDGERRLYSLKEKLLEGLIKKVEDGGQLDADLIKLGLSTIEESIRD